MNERYDWWEALGDELRSADYEAIEHAKRDDEEARRAKCSISAAGIAGAGAAAGNAARSMHADGTRRIYLLSYADEDARRTAALISNDALHRWYEMHLREREKNE